MTDDAAAFEPVEARDLHTPASEVSDEVRERDVEWPSWLDSPWRVAGLWSGLAVGLVGLVYVVTKEMGVYGQFYESPGLFAPRIPFGGLIGGWLLALLSGLGVVQRYRGLRGRDWVRYGFLFLVLVPGFWTVAVLAVLAAPLSLLAHFSTWPGWAAGCASIAAGLAVLLLSLFGWGRQAGWRVLPVLASGLLGAAAFAAPFAPPSEHLFLDVSLTVVLQTLVGFAAVRPLYPPRSSDIRGIVRESTWYYGAALLFATGTVYLLIGVSWVLQGSGTVML